jgi:hypothetical protein
MRITPTVVTWLWGQDKFTAEDVRGLRDQVSEYDFLCITDQKIEGIKTLDPGPPERPAGCLRRMEMFDPDFFPSDIQWILHIDLDTQITGDLDALMVGKFNRIHRTPSVGKNGICYNPGFMLFQVGSLTPLWKLWTSKGLFALRDARKAGWVGSDQAIISHFARSLFELWDDGAVVSYRDDADISDAIVVSYYDRLYEMRNGPRKPRQDASLYAFDGPLNWGRRFARIHKTEVFVNPEHVPSGATAWLPLPPDIQWDYKIAGIANALRPRQIDLVITMVPPVVNDEIIRGIRI